MEQDFHPPPVKQDEYTNNHLFAFLGKLNPKNVLYDWTNAILIEPIENAKDENTNSVPSWDIVQMELSGFLYGTK